MTDILDALPFTQYKKYASPIRIFVAVVIGIQFFGFYELPNEVLYAAGIFGILHLTSIVYE